MWMKNNLHNKQSTLHTKHNITSYVFHGIKIICKPSSRICNFAAQNAWTTRDWTPQQSKNMAHQWFPKTTTFMRMTFLHFTVPHKNQCRTQWNVEKSLASMLFVVFCHCKVNTMHHVVGGHSFALWDWCKCHRKLSCCPRHLGEPDDFQASQQKIAFAIQKLHHVKEHSEFFLMMQSCVNIQQTCHFPQASVQVIVSRTVRFSLHAFQKL